MKSRSLSVMLSLLLAGALAGSALSEEKKDTKEVKETKTAATKKVDTKADLKLIQQAESECKDVQTMIDGLTKTCDGCGQSKDPVVLRGAVDKMAKELKKMKAEEEMLAKQLKNLEFDFHAPIGY